MKRLTVLVTLAMLTSAVPIAIFAQAGPLLVLSAPLQCCHPVARSSRAEGPMGPSAAPVVAAGCRGPSLGVSGFAENSAASG